MKEAIVLLQDCPKLLGSLVTCGSQRVKKGLEKQTDKQTNKNEDQRRKKVEALTLRTGCLVWNLKKDAGNFTVMVRCAAGN